MKKIGIVGHGYLGKAFEVAFKDKCEVFINDIKYDLDNENYFTLKYLVENDMDMILIGVPTPFSKKNGFCCSTIDMVLCDINNLALTSNKRPLVCIKSAVLPSYVKCIMRRFDFIDITVSPEYLSGKDNIRDMINHQVLIVGGANGPRERVIDLFLNHSICNRSVNTGVCSAMDAALIKYMENCFLALKCVFMSEFYELYSSYGDNETVGFNELLRLWMLDTRMGDYPYQIPYFGELGFCSHCLCKDQNAIRTEGVKMPLLTAMSTINDMYREKTGHQHNRCENTPGGVIG